MFRRSICCQYNKLTFSKTNWATATVASALVDEMQNDTASSNAIPPVPPLKPLSFPLQKSSSPTIIVRNAKSVSHFKRCSGYRKYTGKPCTRLIKIDPTLPEKRYYLCHNHEPNYGDKLKEAGKNDQSSDAIKRVRFDTAAGHTQVWIGDHIAPKDRANIKRQMLLPLSERDQAGYIYAYHLQDGPRVSQKDYAYFKIGRTTDPHRRMYQVAHACNFIPKIIELIPGFPDKESNIPTTRMLTNLETVATDAIDSPFGVPKCPMSHRVERLIHLELASVYENAGFKCDKCGSVHREWIRVNRRKRSNGELMTDDELWKSDIRPIVLKWIQFGVVASALNELLLL
ncbi:hypothetical protein [Parasitella parasitica]|uniref:Bacteriophage T5 Orf172 DNA-binding domain-containing protein n=1 Tax=Parasitella parasitica TaxID=35722 RepID=A0A0B7NSZ8_9FUNG|nr:hypothetical protein [Parasitella parasitica]